MPQSGGVWDAGELLIRGRGEGPVGAGITNALTTFGWPEGRRLGPRRSRVPSRRPEGHPNVVNALVIPWKFEFLSKF